MDSAQSSIPKNIDTMPRLVFGWADYSFCGGLLGLSMLIGIYFAFFSKQNTTSEYLFGGRSMAYVPVAISILASFMSGISFIGYPTEVYHHGIMSITVAGTAIIVCLVTSYIFLPVFYDLQLNSVYEYLELRFSKSIRLLASSLYIVSLLLNTTITIYIPALAFSQVTGYAIHTITPIFIFICTTYTTIGGVKAVVWTDSLQFMFTVGGLVTTLIIGVNSIGGLSKVFEIADKGGRLNTFDFDPSPFKRYTFWGMTIGMLFFQVSHISIGQKFVQRFSAIDQENNVRKAILIFCFGWMILHTGCVLTGLILYATYHDCDPFTAHFIEKNDQIMSYYIMDTIGHIKGLAGVVLAGLISSGLSTTSASLNSLAGSIYEDFISRWIKDSPRKERRAPIIMKITTVMIGLHVVGLIFIIERSGTVFEMAHSLSSIVDGPLLGFFILGMLVPWVGVKGAFTGGCISLIFMSWLVGGIEWHIFNKRITFSHLPISVDNCPFSINETLKHHGLNQATPTPTLDLAEKPWMIFNLSFLFLIFTGTLITVIVAVLTSLITRETDLSKVDPRHISPIIRSLLPVKKYTGVSLREDVSLYNLSKDSKFNLSTNNQILDDSNKT